MEADDNHHHTCKRSRVGNGSDEDLDGGEAKGNGGLCSWSQQSRIFRVSRATGGKDRHSKVYTAKGLRDRRVRLSVSTAIQFYDLQDRLGYDQPSKAIEWLIKAASAAIAELPALEASFPVPPRAVEKLEIEPQQQHCSSASETSKGSVLYLSRSENRVKARERARERAAKDKEKDQDDDRIQSSFTDLLTGSGSNGTQMGSTAKQIRYLPVTAMADYFSQSGLFTQAQKSDQPPFSQAGNSSPVGMLPFGIVAATGDHPEFSFLQDHHGPVHAAADYNLNFSIPSCVAGFNRGTLQSNSPSQLPHYHHHLQKLSSPVDGLNLPLFASSATSATSDVNHFPAGLDGRLQLYYGEEHRHADLKGKGKS